MDKSHIAAQLLYLAEHGLIRNPPLLGVDGHISFRQYQATKAGIDFLADDGGLSAVLGVVTIKLHDDTIRSLLIQKIQNSDAEPTIKGELVKQVRSLPAEALKTVTTKLLEAGLQYLPDAIHRLQSMLPHL